MHSASTFSFQHSFDAIRRDRDPVLPFRDPAALLDALHQKAGSPGQKNLILPLWPALRIVMGTRAIAPLR